METRLIAKGFLDFVNFSVSPFHAISRAKSSLLSSKFQELREHESWNLSPGGKYFFTRNESSIYAFSVGSQYTPHEGGFRIIGSHSDFPCPKLAPVSKYENEGFIKLNIQLYGGGLWHSWFDRDLTLAGRVIVSQNNQIHSKLLHIKRPIISIPQLAIHLTTNRENFEFNKETQFKPLLCTGKAEKENYPENNKRHAQGLLELISKEIGCKTEEILDLDLCIIDTAPAVLSGLYEEFISSARLDNLMSAYCSLQSLINSNTDGKDIKLLAAFDNEEVGSLSMQGANSIVAEQTFRRILETLPGNKKNDAIEGFFRRSLALSADMAHAVHPNYSDKHQTCHSPIVHGGVVIKANPNQKYATDPVGAAFIRTLAKKYSIPTQDFIVKNNSPCGSTIGPYIAGNTGIRVIDIGAPMLAMHSCREIMGVDDAYYYMKIMAAFYDDSQNYYEGALLG
ncbi:unnamed protein product [Blepharisma stoltei]|uniref:aspartyl aminopeptidase n=1 Tax=Blepharisma stoltei TaxID=1481888 RepID=A0AAU9IN84_9CILI|nr:unnamed protein product [Blepharisma stoltei]